MLMFGVAEPDETLLVFFYLQMSLLTIIWQEKKRNIACIYETLKV